MVKKRIIGVITIKNNLVVQSFSYSRYLPIGKPECVIENLDRWGADEILIQVIDRSINNLGPNFDLLNKIGRLKISTPIIYSGGIRNHKDAIEVIKNGADRIVVDTLLRKDKKELTNISMHLGSQAVIASVPVILKNNEIYFYNYISKNEEKINKDYLSTISDKNLISEILLINKKTEGFLNSFDFKIISLFPKIDSSLIVFGGISEGKQIDQILLSDNVSAVGIGNFLNYKEHSIQLLKQSVGSNYLRKPNYNSINSYED
ncbi:HisA/HisF-related TIM barrel protein [Flavobacteriaceae bacterium]|nr:HisA/HisF-related TIM barrel protein [Flavobacteriaceae bacterium]